MKREYVRYAIVLGLMAAVGPFGIDMYLPALPAIAADLEATTAAVQMTLMAYFVAFGVLQIAYGPTADMVGRKPPLYFGLSLFTIGSIGCALAPGIEWLIGFRVLQGAGAAAMMVIPRAIIRDLYTGIAATRLMAMVMLVIAVSPMLAPLVGSALIVPFGWRSAFVAVTMAAMVSAVMLTFFLKETLAPADRVAVNLASMRRGFGRLLRDPVFMGLTFIAGFGMASFFAFLSTASFLYIEHFGLTPTEFALAFAVNAAGFFAASQTAASLGVRFGITRVVMFGVTGFFTAMMVLLAITVMGVDSLFAIIVLLLLGNSCMGLVVPTSMVLALEQHGPIAGLASALGGTLQMSTGVVMIVIVSAIFDGTPLPMVSAIAACAVAAFTLARLTLPRVRLAPEPAE